jgi:DNA ligase-1
MNDLFGKLKSTFFILVLITIVAPANANQTALPVQLAQIFKGENVSTYLVSEKYDGVRAIWKDDQLRTRSGNLINAPTWFTQDLPAVWLDGELWSERGNFEIVLSTVSKNKPIDTEWRQIKYMVFDAPNYEQVFAARADFYEALLESLNLSHVEPVKQFTINSNAELSELLLRLTQRGAEGLMLQKADALFSVGRSNNLLKLKPYMDAEAVVIRHLMGKGKYENSLGALLVSYQNAKGHIVEFRIGTGFSDKERENPPPLGSQISFKYHGYTKNGVPRFASFLRVRESQN